MDLFPIPQILRYKTLKNLPQAKNSLFSPRKHDSFLTPRLSKPLMQIGEISTQNNSRDSSPKLFFPKFKVANSIFFKKSSSLSPENKNIDNNAIIKDDKFDFSRLKKAKLSSQESEIKLQHLYNELREICEKNGNLTEKLRICFEMIDSVFIFNEKSTNQFKEIAFVLKEAIYCKKKTAQIAAEVLEENNQLVGEEYRVVLGRIFPKIMEINGKHEEEIAEKEKIIAKMAKEIEKKNEEKQHMEQFIRDCEEKVRKKYQEEILEYQNQEKLLEEEISKLKSENYNLKCNIDRRILEFEANEQMIHAKNEAEKQKISQEKDDIIYSRETQIKGFQELKLLYGKLSINHRTLCASMKVMKEKLDHSQEHISDLMNENQTLKVRAGIAWDEMTPRPSFEQLQDFLHLDKEFFKCKSTRTLLSEISGLVICRALLRKGTKEKTRKATMKSIKNIDDSEKPHLSHKNSRSPIPKNCDVELHLSRKPSKNRSPIQNSPFLRKNSIHTNTKTNRVRIAILNAEQEDHENLQTPNKNPMTNSIGSFLFPPHSLKDLDSSCSIPIDEDKKGDLQGSLHHLDDEPRISRNNSNSKFYNGNAQTGERMTERSKTVPPRKSILLAAGLSLPMGKEG